MNNTNKIVIIAVGLFGLAAGLTCAGCTPLLEKYAKYAAKRETERTFELHVPRTDELRYCMKNPGGLCKAPTTGALGLQQPTNDWKFQTFAPKPTTQPNAISTNTATESTEDLGASAARNALNHAFQQKLNVLYQAAAAAPMSDTDAAFIASRNLAEIRGSEENRHVTITTTVDELDAYQKLVEEATLLDGWSALHAQASTAQFSNANPAALAADKARRAYISTYFKAYFRSGRVVQLTVNAADLKARIVAKLKDELPGLSDADYNKLVQRRLEDLGFDASTNRIFGKFGTKKFVTRDGQELQFPGFSASIAVGSSDISRTDIDYVAVGADLIRVLLHAMYDANNQTPAVSNATGVTELKGLPFALAVNDASRVSAEKFEQIEIRANQVEGVVAAGTGRIIRGISVIALNNEALATVIETAVGLAVRKTTETTLYCWYACGPTKADPTALPAPQPDKDSDSIKLTIQLGGLPQP